MEISKRNVTPSLLRLTAVLSLSFMSQTYAVDGKSMLALVVSL